MTFFFFHHRLVLEKISSTKLSGLYVDSQTYYGRTPNRMENPRRHRRFPAHCLQSRRVMAMRSERGCPLDSPKGEKGPFILCYQPVIGVALRTEGASTMSALWHGIDRANRLTTVVQNQQSLRDEYTEKSSECSRFLCYQPIVLPGERVGGYLGWDPVFYREQPWAGGPLSNEGLFYVGGGGPRERPPPDRSMYVQREGGVRRRSWSWQE